MDGKKLEIRQGDLGNIYPNDLDRWYFPNWYDKEHFSEFLGRDLTDQQFKILKTEMENDLMDEISDIVNAYLSRHGEEILKEKGC
jgi:hypothetical protein